VSYSLAIVDGDLALQGDRLDLVFGVDKLKQDLNCWLKERYGGDRFHTNYGSILPDSISSAGAGVRRPAITSSPAARSAGATSRPRRPLAPVTSTLVIPRPSFRVLAAANAELVEVR
jgi:hypothetical protein